MLKAAPATPVRRPQSELMAAIVRELLAAPDPDKRTGYLTEAAIYDGSVSIEKLFSTVGLAMMSSMGGASGAIFGTLFRDGGKALTGKESFGAAELAAFLRAACDGVMARGKANPGDKTMIDALHPAAAKAAESAGEPDALAARR